MVAEKPYHVCGVEVMRCLTDGHLMTESLAKEGFCAGHRLAQPAYPTLSELVLLKFGIYARAKSTYWRFLKWLSK